MHEFIRLHHVGKSSRDRKILNDYNVCIFKGEILYIQDNNRHGKEYLKRILTGKEQIDDGMIYYKGEKLDSKKAAQDFSRTCVAIGNHVPVIDEMSITENLVVLNPVHFPFCCWNKNTAEKITLDILQSIGIQRNPQTMGSDLTQTEKIKLCIAKAVMSGVELIVLDDLMNSYRNHEIIELNKIMRQYCKNGISFLIFTNKMNAFYETESRIQIMQSGRDLMEWQQQMNVPSQTDFKHFNNIKQDDSNNAGRIIYIIDKLWNGPDYGKKYLNIFKENNSEMWSKYMERVMDGMESSGRKQYFLRKGNQMFDGETAIIPYNSADMLLENMSLEDNISICIPKQTERRGTIHKNARKILKRVFLDRVHRYCDIDSIQGISLWERKALSIYRWELANPKVLLIDDPFAELNMNETLLLDAYLGEIRKKRIEIIVFLPEWNSCITNFDLILSATAGKKGKVEKH